MWNFQDSIISSEESEDFDDLAIMLHRLLNEIWHGEKQKLRKEMETNLLTRERFQLSNRFWVDVLAIGRGPQN